MRKGINHIWFIVGLIIGLFLAVLLGQFAMAAWDNAGEHGGDIMDETSCSAEIMRICLEKNSEGIAKMKIESDDYCDYNTEPEPEIVHVDGTPCPCIINKDTECGY